MPNLTTCALAHNPEALHHRECNGKQELRLPTTPVTPMINGLRMRRITQADYDKKATELKNQQAELRMRIEQHSIGQDEFRMTLETLISLASRAVDIFERSKTEQKRQLIGFVFSNLQLKGKR